jgi:ATP-dependent RNA helicase DHX57
MYDPDPFSARKAVADRQEKAAKKKEEAQKAANSPSLQSELDPLNDSLEVKLSTDLRELVEKAIRMVFILRYILCIRPLTFATGHCR